LIFVGWAKLYKQMNTFFFNNNVIIEWFGKQHESHWNIFPPLVVVIHLEGEGMSCEGSPPNVEISIDQPIIVHVDI
jgi:hypothetical protein